MSADRYTTKNVIPILLIVSILAILFSFYILRLNQICRGKKPVHTLFEAMEKAVFLPRDYVIDFSKTNSDEKGNFQINVGPMRFILG